MKVIKFYADWCRPCKSMTPIFDALEEENTDVEFESINVDDKALVRAYEVGSIPTFIIMDGDAELDRRIGPMPQSAFQDWINEYK